jgi:hypothetical protein
MKSESGHEKYCRERDAYEAAYKAVLAQAPHEQLKWVAQEAKKRARLAVWLPQQSKPVQAAWHEMNNWPGYSRERWQAYHTALARQAKERWKPEPQWVTALFKVISASGVLAFIVSVPDFIHMIAGQKLRHTPLFGYWLCGVLIGGMVLGCVVILAVLTVAGSYRLRYAFRRKAHRTVS